MRKNFWGTFLIILFFVIAIPVWAADSTTAGTADPLSPLLGKSFNDPELQKSLDQFGKWTKGEEGLFGFDCQTDQGLVFNFGNRQGSPVVEGIVAKRPYAGVLPWGITFKDTRDKLNKRFGTPIDVRTNIDVWDFMNMRLMISYGTANTIEIVDLILSYQLIKYPNITPADPGKQKLFPAELQKLIGEEITASEVATFLKNLGKPEAVKQDQQFLYRAPLNCITIRADHNKTITNIDISRELVNGEYHYYPGILPGGLNWDDNRVQVEKKWGIPTEMVVVLGAPPQAVYKFMGIEVLLEYEPDPANLKNQVMRKISLQQVLVSEEE